MKQRNGKFFNVEREIKLKHILNDYSYDDAHHGA